MLFRVLGPLEVVDGEQPIALGGTKQRATLGFLLLHANRVVATSKLLDALWSTGEPPATARKILQNAIWGLRGVLSSNTGEPGSATLVTRAPGYMIQVDDDQVDLSLFRRRVKDGRTRLEAGAPAEAAEILRDALGLWRGSALADLVEAGISWPELTAAENARMDAMEDYFEAELMCGRHQSTLGALEAMVDAEPLRERLCGQLMLALYRCGRQADALSAYGRMRSTLVEDLGVEPRRELQVLQHAILNQDAALNLTEVPAPRRSVADVASHLRGGEQVEASTTGGTDAPTARTEPPARTGGTGRLSSVHGTPARADEQPRRLVPTQGGPEVKRERVSVLLIQSRLDFAESTDPNDIDQIRDGVGDKLRELVELYDGTVVTSIGSISLAVFRSHGGTADHAERAVRVATAIAGRLNDAVRANETDASPVQGKPSVHAAVCTGEAVLRYDADGTLQTAHGALLERCQTLLSSVPSGEVWVCDDTRQETASVVVYRRVDNPVRSWQVTDIRSGFDTLSTVRTVDRELELNVLRGTLERVRHRAVPHMVTLLGEPGSGKSQLLLEFERRVTEQPAATQVVVSHTPPVARESTRAVLASIVSSYCGILPSDSPRIARDKLADGIQRVVGFGERSRRLLWCLSALVAPAENASRRNGLDDVLDASREFITAAAIQRPLAMIIEDVHWADDSLLDFLADLGNWLGSAPVLVIVAGRPELLRRRPGWGGGMHDFITITIDPLPADCRLPVDGSAHAQCPRDRSSGYATPAGGEVTVAAG